MSHSLSGMRKDYKRHTLSEENSSLNPFSQFENWFNTAKEENEGEANAMVVSTVNKNGAPSSRVVLLKDFSEKGFIFFTNYLSRKGNEISSNPVVALLFFWPGLERQIRIEGMAEKISGKDSDEYFLSRPKESNISAIISPQSQIVPNREFLENKYKEAEKLFNQSVKRPEHWGGYKVTPGYFEFWQGRAGRLHDRLSYRLIDKGWLRERLAP